MKNEVIKSLVRKTYYFPIRLKDTLSYYLSSKKSGNRKLAIVVIVKNEGKYIDEWIRYHKLVGVDHIYIYDNNSDDDTYNIAEKYTEEGFVTLIKYPGQGVQLEVYDDAIKKHGNDVEYMAMIDADEFLFSTTNKSVKDTIVEIFESHPRASGLAINWRMFGSSGFKEKPKSGGVIDNFLYCSEKRAKGNDCIKTIVRPSKVFRYIQCHFPMYIIGGYSIDENGSKVKYWFNKHDDESKIRINHYFTKSLEEWKERRSLPKADFKDPTILREINEFYEHDNNEIYDDRMLPFANRLKEQKH